MEMIKTASQGCDQDKMEQHTQNIWRLVKSRLSCMFILANFSLLLTPHSQAKEGGVDARQLPRQNKLNPTEVFLSPVTPDDLLMNISRRGSDSCLLAALRVG